ncbi:hypothetical protein ACFXPW_33405 [Streptomyces goshikiensis]|uniref:hypothetical protein n=1 Tax=Streptomyces goshikiensis TaxID=1942 RepID=UPI0036B17039
MSEQTSTTAQQAYEALVQTVTEVAADPWAPGAEERLSAAAYAANAAVYPKSEG